MCKIPSGRQNLIIEVKRSDGKIAKSSLFVNIKPKKVATIFILADSNEKDKDVSNINELEDNKNKQINIDKEYLNADELTKFGLDIYCNNIPIKKYFIEDLYNSGTDIILLIDSFNKLLFPSSKFDIYKKSLPNLCESFV